MNAGQSQVNKPLLAAAGALAVFAALLIWSWARELEHKYRPGEPVEILVSRVALPAGSKLSKDQLEVREYPSSYAHNHAVKKIDLFAVDGRMLSLPLQRGQQLLWTDLEGAEAVRKKSLGEFVPKGQRALTLTVDRVSSAGGNLRPNDRVDILATLPQPGGDEVTIPLLQNVSVVATGSELGREGSMTTAPQRGEGFVTVSVLVTPEEAQRLTFAQVKGRISLVVRNPDDATSFENLASVTWRSLLNDGERKELQRKRDETIEPIGAITPGR